MRTIVVLINRALQSQHYSLYKDRVRLYQHTSALSEISQRTRSLWQKPTIYVSIIYSYIIISNLLTYYITLGSLLPLSLSSTRLQVVQRYIYQYLALRRKVYQSIRQDLVKLIQSLQYRILTTILLLKRIVTCPLLFSSLSFLYQAQIVQLIVYYLRLVLRLSQLVYRRQKYS